MAIAFTHLNLHTEYSIVDSLVRIPDLIKRLKKMGMHTCAITDQNNLFGAIKFYKACEKAGIKPILGTDILMQAEKKTFPATLLCMDLQGYKHLSYLLSKAYQKNQHLTGPAIEKKWLRGFTEGLIMLSGGQAGDIGQALLARQMSFAENLCATWQDLFPDRFYITLHRTGKPHEALYNTLGIELALKSSLPVAAINPVRFLDPEDFDAHEARVCIHEGRFLNDAQRPRNYTPDYYLKSADAMAKLFADIPEALENTHEISQRCNLVLPLGKIHLPQFPAQEKSLENLLTERAQVGLKKRFRLLKPPDETVYIQRLNSELMIINQMKFTEYFLIVADFITWAKENHIPVGPGRGSGVGSLTAYSLGITDIDPLDYGLLFERFLNPERISMPDFDVDFCMENRDRVMEYVALKYGHDQVCQIITFGTLAAKAVIRDAGRVLGYPYGYVDKLAKLIPFELGMTLDKALKQENDLYERYQKEDDVKTLIDLAKKLEGLMRNASKHAGGIVIAPSLLTDFMPLFCEPSKEKEDKKNEPALQWVSQFDKDDVETIGLVKFDFLGLRTLTVITDALQHINQNKNQNKASPDLSEDLLEIAKLPKNDHKTFELIKTGHTTALFQLESRGMKELVKRLQPEKFEEIVALVALFRPGPLQSGMVDDFINRKHGRASVTYPHPLLQDLLKETYGIILYQEQVMQIAQAVAGYTLGQADNLRKAMGKKKPEEMAKQRAVFMQGAAEKQNIPKKTAQSLFDLMEKFSGYGFNKSHAVAYALLTYQTAYLKAHYPAEFMAAVLSSDMDKTEKIIGFLNETKRMGIPVIPPTIQDSDYIFTVKKEKNAQPGILYGLGAIKGLGKTAVLSLIHERQTKGLFKDFIDFCKRIDLKKINRRAIEALIKSGSLDALHPCRAVMLANIALALDKKMTVSTQQQDLFHDLEDTTSLAPTLKQASPWTFQQTLQAEKETLGFYQTAHPLDRYYPEFQSFMALSPARQGSFYLGHITKIKILHTKNGQPMAFLTLETLDKILDVTVFATLFKETKPWLQKDSSIILEGQVGNATLENTEKIIARQLYNPLRFRETFAKGLALTSVPSDRFDTLFKTLSECLDSMDQTAAKKFPVFIYYQDDSMQTPAKLKLGENFYLPLEDILIEKLVNLLGKEHIKILY